MQQYAGIYLFIVPEQQPSSSVAYRPRWRKVVAQILWPVPEAAVTVLCSPDDGVRWTPETCRE